MHGQTLVKRFQWVCVCVHFVVAFEFAGEKQKNMVLHSWSLCWFHEPRLFHFLRAYGSQLIYCFTLLVAVHFMRSIRQHTVAHRRLPCSVFFFFYFSRYKCVFACAHVGNGPDIVVWMSFEKCFHQTMTNSQLLIAKSIQTIQYCVNEIAVKSSLMIL